MSDLCRLCGEYKPLEDLSCIAEDDSSVVFKLESCLSIKLDCDKLLPRSSCFTCIHTLDIAFKFAEQVVSVQEKLKYDLQYKLSLVASNTNFDYDLDEYNNFEIKIERLDSTLYEFLSSDELIVKQTSTTTSRQSNSKKGPKLKPSHEKKKIFKKYIEWDDEELSIRPTFWKRHKNFGIKAPKQVIRYSMKDLFKKELRGKFAVESKEMEIDVEDRMPLGKLSSRANERLAKIGWFNYEWKCYECADTFSNVIEMEKHSKNVHKKRCVVCCEPCHKTYKNYASFLLHVTSTHQPLLKYSCIICSEFYTSFLHLHQHISKVHPSYNVYICLYCGDYKFVGSAMKDHIADKHIPIAKIFSCDLCPMIFDKKQRILSHMKNFHLTKSFICELCASSYKSQAELVQHQKAAHNNLYEEKCPFCEKVFKNRRQQRRHIKEIHEDFDLKIPCEICSHVSKSKRQHAVHKRHHRATYKCKYCDRAFRYQSGYRYHTRTHTGERLYLCPVEGCGKRDIDYPNCNKHIKTTHGLAHLKPIKLPINST